MNILEEFLLLVAAFVAALFGQGGGVLYTPLQVWTGVDFHTAAPISLFLILIISISSTLVFRKAHQVDWYTALALEVPSLATSSASDWAPSLAGFCPNMYLPRPLA